jgi:hypothetical protein
MGNTLGPNGFSRVPACRSHRRNIQIIVHEGDEPNMVVHLLDADFLASECRTKVDFLPIEADAAACGLNAVPDETNIFSQLTAKRHLLWGARLVRVTRGCAGRARVALPLRRTARPADLVVHSGAGFC